MNWASIHNIIDSLSKQISVKKLNNLAINYCSEFLIDSNYRLYLMESVQGGNILDVIAYDISPQPSEFEASFTNEIAKKGYCKTPYTEKDGFAYFYIGVNRRCTALVVASREKDAISDSKFAILKTIIALWNNQLSLLHHFQRDYLTSLFNREYFLETLNSDNFEEYNDDITKLAQFNQDLDQRASIEKAERSAVLLIDIIDFARINDEYGYSIGDEVLIAMANLIRLSFRENDIYSRYNGDVFAVFIHQTTACAVESIIERFIDRIKHSNFPVVHQIQVKIGYTLVTDGTLASELIQHAADALLLAKRSDDCFKQFNNPAAEQHKIADVHIGDIEFFDGSEK